MVFYNGNYEEPKDSEYWKLPLAEKMKLVPELMAPVMSKIFTEEERDHLFVDLYFPERKLMTCHF